ncbi:MAG: hypothetical protein NXI27_08605 [Alphaproteobacteria bacterium]|nr:hypothetical protein [Alphaproteobacteria bacterium]
MSTSISRSGTDGDVDDIIQLLEQPVSTRLCQETSTINGRRVPTCALIMLSIVGAVALLAFIVWPGRPDAPQAWETREIALPNGAGTAYLRDRVVDSFYGTKERRIDIDGAIISGTVWLPVAENAGNTFGDFYWHEVGSTESSSGPWLEIDESTASYLIDLREIVLYRIHRVEGHLCAVALGEAFVGTSAHRTTEPACAHVGKEDGPAIDISAWADIWSTRHLGVLDRPVRFVPGRSTHTSMRGGNPIRGKPLDAGNSTANRSKPCDNSIPSRVLSGPPRLEYVGVVNRPEGAPCRGQPTSPRS